MDFNIMTVQKSSTKDCPLNFIDWLIDDNTCQIFNSAKKQEAQLLQQ